MIELHLPLPLRDLSPNRRVHWAAKNRAVQAYRVEVGWLVKEQQLEGIPLEGPVRVFLTFNVRSQYGDGRYRPRDQDNALSAFKAGFDGMTDAGVWTDDSQMEIAGVSIERNPGEPGVTVRLEG